MKVTSLKKAKTLTDNLLKRQKLERELQEGPPQRGIPAPVW